jgi:hypothetical protein
MLYDQYEDRINEAISLQNYELLQGVLVELHRDFHGHLYNRKPGELTADELIKEAYNQLSSMREECGV